MKKVILTGLLVLGFNLNVQAEEMFELSDSCSNDVMNMIKCKVIEDVSADDAIESMKLRANFLNFKLVGYMPLSEQVKANGGESNRMEIFQFCDANIAAQMVKHSMAFAGYLPCRISVVEDDAGQAWLITLNMDNTMGDASLPKELQGLGMKVRNNIYSIISAGAEGDL
ncbi:MAG: DUF302 domain-containing protein [Gammaproteobacteria bacterium]|nr:DUF302 domain-containing protein [Gammaproteobacteria bacterium]